MANAPRDNNRVPVLLGTLNTDGLTVVPVKVNASTHGIKISNGTSGSDNGRGTAVRDDNRVPVLLGVSSADGTTPIEVYVDSSGNLLTTTA